MTSRQFWIGIAVIVLAVLAHAAVPRYEWRQDAHVPLVWTRIDRWTGALQVGAIQPGGAWAAASDPAFRKQ